MTLIIGAIAKDGIVFGADSQIQFWSGVDVKRLGERKLFSFEIPIKKGEIKFLIGGAGNLSDIQWGLSSLYQILTINCKEVDPKELSHDFIRGIVENAIFVLHKHYNVDRYREMDINISDPDAAGFFNPIFILGTFINEDPLLLRILPNGRSEISGTFFTAGSGSAYAELLMGLTGYAEDQSIEEVALKVYQTIEYAESIDPNVGGPIEILILKKNNELLRLYEEDIVEISKTLGDKHED